MPANVKSSKLISAPPALVRATDGDLVTYLAGLPAPDFLTVADPKALWAVRAANSGDATTGGTAFIVSAETYKWSVKGHNYDGKSSGEGG